MSTTTVSGPFRSTGGIYIGDGATNFAQMGTGDLGTVHSYNLLPGSKTAIAQNTATKLFTLTVPNVNASAGGRILCNSVLTQSRHTGDSSRIVEYLWTLERVAGNVAVMTIALASATATQIATSGAVGAYTFTSVLAAAAVSGGATAVNSFDITITNTAGTSSTSDATFLLEMLNNIAGGVTVS